MQQEASAWSGVRSGLSDLDHRKNSTEVYVMAMIDCNNEASACQDLSVDVGISQQTPLPLRPASMDELQSAAASQSEQTFSFLNTAGGAVTSSPPSRDPPLAGPSHRQAQGFVLAGTAGGAAVSSPLARDLAAEAMDIQPRLAQAVVPPVQSRSAAITPVSGTPLTAASALSSPLGHVPINKVPDGQADVVPDISAHAPVTTGTGLSARTILPAVSAADGSADPPIVSFGGVSSSSYQQAQGPAAATSMSLSGASASAGGNLVTAALETVPAPATAPFSSTGWPLWPSGMLSGPGAMPVDGSNAIPSCSPFGHGGSLFGLSTPLTAPASSSLTGTVAGVAGQNLGAWPASANNAHAATPFPNSPHGSSLWDPFAAANAAKRSLPASGSGAATSGRAALSVVSSSQPVRLPSAVGLGHSSLSAAADNVSGPVTDVVVPGAHVGPAPASTPSPAAPSLHVPPDPPQGLGEADPGVFGHGDAAVSASAKRGVQSAASVWRVLRLSIQFWILAKDHNQRPGRSWPLLDVRIFECRPDASSGSDPTCFKQLCSQPVIWHVPELALPSHKPKIGCSRFFHASVRQHLCCAQLSRSASQSHTSSRVVHR